MSLELQQDGVPTPTAWFNEVVRRTQGYRDVLSAASGGTITDEVIQAEVDSAVAGDTILLPRATYDLDGTVLIDKALRIMMAEGAQAAVTGSNHVFQVSEDIDGLILDGVRTSGTGTGNLLRVDTAVTLGELLVRNCRTDRQTIAMFGGATGAVVIEGNRVGDGVGNPVIAIGVTNPISRGALFRNIVVGDGATTNSGHYQISGQLDHLMVHGNRSIASGGDAFDIDVGGRLANIMGNYAINPQEGGYEVKFGNGSRPDSEGTEHVVFMGNHAIGAVLPGVSWRVRGSCIGNVLKDCREGINIGADTPPGNLISGNHFIAGGGGTNACQLFIHGDVDDIDIIGNQFINSLTNALRINGGSGIRVRNNYFRSWSVASGHRAITFQNGATDGLVTENKFTGAGAGGAVAIRVDNDCRDIIIEPTNVFTDVDDVDTVLVNTPEPATAISAGSQRRRDFTDLDATPSVAAAKVGAVYRENYSAPTNITDFDHGLDSQVITIHFLSGNATLIHGASKILVSGGANYAPPAGTVMQFIALRDDNVNGVKWVELSRREP